MSREDMPQNESYLINVQAKNPAIPRNRSRNLSPLSAQSMALCMLSNPLYEWCLSKSHTFNYIKAGQIMPRYRTIMALQKLKTEKPCLTRHA